MMLQLYFVVGMTLISAFFAWAERIDRLDVYDNADNHLLFVTFEYDGAGKNIGRSVYASDSTFLRATSVTKDAGGNITAENSVDYENNPLFSTRLSARAGATNMTIGDQFKVDMLGSPFTFTETSGDNYDISQGGAPVYKQSYEFSGDGSLRRVTFMDKSGTRLYYATASAQNGIVSPGASAALGGRPLFRAAADGRLLVTLELASPSRVRVELFTAAGRCAAVTDKAYTAGRQVISAAHRGAIGNGTYILRVSVNGAPSVHERLVLLAR